MNLRSELARVRKPLDAVLRSRLVGALAAPRDIDEYLQLIDPVWSVHAVRARVVSVERDGDRAVSLWLAPNGAWRGFRAGQYVQLGVEIAGVRHSRCFSISSAPSDDSQLRLSLQLLPGGKLSTWASETAAKGDVVLLSQAQGEFVLPAKPPSTLLMISAGSGITPMLSMLRELARGARKSRVTWLHYGRSETMLESEALALAAKHAWLSLVLTRTQGPHAAPGALRHLSAEALAEHAPDWREQIAFACGPAALLQAARDLFSQHGCERSLRLESFGDGWPSAPVDHTPLHAQLVFKKSGREVAGNAGRTLLEQAEAAGLRPAYGCRMGICHTCKCTKLSGAVRNAQTGVVSDKPNEIIRLCISTPRSDVTLDL
jgi:ferredoxin-NADP reductase